MTLLREDFTPGQPASAVPASWYNAVAHFINNLVGALGIVVFKHTDPPTVSLDPEAAVDALAEFFVTLATAQTLRETKSFKAGKGIVLKCGDEDETPVAIRSYSGSVGFFILVGSGTGNKILQYHGASNEVTLGGGTVTSVKLGSSPSVAPASLTNSTRTKVATLGWVESYYLPLSAVGASGGAAAYSHAHGNITRDGKLNTLNAASVFLVTDSSGNITDSRNGEAPGDVSLTVANARAIFNLFEEVSGGLIKLIEDALPDEAVKTDDIGAATDPTGRTGVAALDEDGKVPLSSLEQPDSTATPKVLTFPAGASAPTWAEGGAGTNPSSVTSMTAVRGSTADATTWTAGGQNGLSVDVVTRTVWTGVFLYEFRRTFTYDKEGRLYSVSGETRYTVDEPFDVRWGA